MSDYPCRMTEIWPVEPPVAGTEQEHLVGMLDRLRATFRWKAGGLDAEQLARRTTTSALTLGGLLKHLTYVEDIKLSWAFEQEPGEPWRSVDWDADPDWEFRTAALDSPAELYSRYDRAVSTARRRLTELLDEGGLDMPTARQWQGQTVLLRRIVCDLVEEYGRHTGHADLIREAIDGLVGEDPPEGWQPS
ncbi:Protein of uncharacterised function (DUF664) [Acidipropionibacterium jensenii]|uniref:Protein of uncharacterized function (DUF664) n=2 Tax=Acidipropionibacterium jensenii TaxID=1749 RepID=A0A448P074_9ACTN|nr:DinB family protein [Acidipropionibacterium jensenii]VEI03593.1 Protein of uncharacterised function (DUF664) [Acidipropionibacterium jensenii]